MREIKFRAWIPASKEMIEIGVLELDRMVGHDYYNFYDRYAGTTAYFDPQLGEGKKSFLMQYTSLKDKHGKEIYESDVIEDHFGHVWTVVFQDGCFWLYRKGFRTTNQMMSWPVDCYPMFRVDHSKYSKVIGNIHQNPELCQ